MWMQPVDRNGTRRRVPRVALAAGVALGLCAGAVAPLVHAQGASGVRLESGLLSFFTGAGRTVLLTVTEVGSDTAESRVRLVYRDAADQVVARDEGRLGRGTPYTFELPLEMGDPRVQLRVSVTIARVRGSGSAPVVSVESVDAGSFAIEERVTCAPPASREGPVTPFCPEFVVTSFSAGG